MMRNMIQRLPTTCINRFSSCSSSKVNRLRSKFEAASQEKAVAELISLAEEERLQLEIVTREQGSSDLWELARAGRITAPIFYRVHTRVESL